MGTNNVAIEQAIQKIAFKHKSISKSPGELQFETNVESSATLPVTSHSQKNDSIQQLVPPPSTTQSDQVAPNFNPSVLQTL